MRIISFDLKAGGGFRPCRSICIVPQERTGESKPDQSPFNTSTFLSSRCRNGSGSGWRVGGAVSNAGGLGLIAPAPMYPGVAGCEHIFECVKLPPKTFMSINAAFGSSWRLALKSGIHYRFYRAGNPKKPDQPIAGKTLLQSGARGFQSCKVFARKSGAAGRDAVVAEGSQPREAQWKEGNDHLSPPHSYVGAGSHQHSPDCRRRHPGQHTGALPWGYACGWCWWPAASEESPPTRI